MHICFICTGNICRSPMAAIIFREQLRRSGLSDCVTVTSAGTGTWHTGKPIDHRAARALSEHGYPSHHVAAPLGERNMDADLYVVMDVEHKAALEEIVADASRIRMLRSFDGDSEKSSGVPDPYYGDDRAFDDVLTVIQAAVPGLIDWVRSRSANARAADSGSGIHDPADLPAQRAEADRLGEEERPRRAAMRLGELLPAFERVYGPEHLETLIARDIHAHWVAEGGDFLPALRAFQSYLPVWERVAGPEHPGTLHCRQNVAYWTGEAGDFAQAAKLSRELLPVRELVLGPAHPDTLLTRHRLAYWIGESGDPAAALSLFEELLDIRVERQGTEHADTLTARHEIARRTGETGKPEAAAEFFEELVPRRERVLGPRHISMLTTRHEHARWTGEAGAPQKALDMLRELLPIREEVQGPDHPRTLLTRHELGRWMAVSGDRAGAVSTVREVLHGRDRVLGPHHPHTRQTRDLLAGLGLR
ncbi:tetratricopeptide repeat protein [Streptomyces sp. NPDC059785]|uniref:tetratricopeptide repeat protein n=1 Tax=Streptomyces sp. NPDC059785 TaxID=3346945 RepID=UPI003664B86D